MAFSWDSVVDGFGDLVTDPRTWGTLAGLYAGSQNGQDQTTTQAPYLYPGQGEGIANVINLAGQEYQSGPQEFYPGQQVAGLDPNTIAGQNSALGTTGVQQQLADLGTFGAGDLLQGGAGRIDGFNMPDQVGFGIDQGLENAVMNPIMRQLQERTLPGLDLQATNQGAFGGTRQGQMKANAVGNATGQAADAVARANLQARSQSIGQRSNDVNALLSGRGQDITQNQVYNNAIRSGVSAIPGAMDAQLAPSNIMQQVGGQRQMYEQALIDSDKTRFDFNQQAPIDALTRLQQRMTLNAPGGATQTTQGQQANLMTMLQGGFAGFNAGSQFTGNNNLQPENVQPTGSLYNNQEFTNSLINGFQNPYGG